MSIIHEALKKVQRSLASKAVKDSKYQAPSTTPSTPTNSAYIYNNAPATETLPAAEQPPKSPVINKIKSILALFCALVITIGSVGYIYLQFQNNIPHNIANVQSIAKQSYYKLVHKKILPDFKTAAPQVRKPMAQLTINVPATTSTTPAPSPVTMNVHGVMANGSGGNLVLIDDQVYQEGDEVEGAKIIKINLDSIEILNNGKIDVIRVKR
jgi:hypothetical protein